MLTLLTLLPTAQAFCGAYVGDADTMPTNQFSRIAIARGSGYSWDSGGYASDSDVTTLTMFNDVQGDLASFALVVPLPELIAEQDVRLVDRAVLERLDEYTSPRLVAYTCEDLYPLESQDTGWSSGSSGGFGCNRFALRQAPQDDAGSWDSGVDNDTGGVTVHEQFDLGEYSAYVLEAQGSAGLLGWLDANGFSLTPELGTALQEYIDGGSYFLALKVDLERVPSDRTELSPLQLRYHSEAWSLPIKLGSVNSAGVQDLIVYTITDPAQGKVAIANVPESALPEDECMVDLDSISDLYADGLTASLGLPEEPALLEPGQEGFGWVTEYSWGSGSCDPCPPGGPLDSSQVFELGFDGHYGFHVTRLHARYTPGGVTQDLSLYATNIPEQSQVRYIQHKWELESTFPMCGEAQPEEPGDCYTADYWAKVAEGEVEDPPYASWFFLTLPGLFLLWRRR